MGKQRVVFKSCRRVFCLLIIGTLFGVAEPAQAQLGLQGGLNFLLGFPQDEFDDNVEENGAGIAGEFLYSPRSTPLGFGLSFGYLNYGRESRREPFSSTIPDVTVEVVTTNNILLGHLLLRAQSKKGVLQPYVDGLVGFSYLFTETEIKDIDDPDFAGLVSSKNLDDAVFSYGGGGGLMIKVYTGKTKRENQPRMWSVLIDLKMHYLVGGEAEYLKKGSVRRSDGKVSYDIIKSKTDLLTAQIGVAVSF